MDLSRIEKLAGLPLTESKMLTEESKEKHAEVLIQKAGPGLLGDMVNIIDADLAKALAEMFGIKKGAKPVKVGKVFIAYDDQQLVFGTNEHDMQEDEED